MRLSIIVRIVAKFVNFNDLILDICDNSPDYTT